MDVVILPGDNLPLKSIGEELIRERHSGLSFSLWTERALVRHGDVVVALEEDREFLGSLQGIFLTKNAKAEGIFLYQGKEIIKGAILAQLHRIGGAPLVENTLEVLGVFFPDSPFMATAMSHCLAKIMAEEGKKVCLLSLNLFFPLVTHPSGKGLLKALYYSSSGEELGPGILSFHTQLGYHTIDCDLDLQDLDGITDKLIPDIKTLLLSKEYELLLFDLPVFLWGSHPYLPREVTSWIGLRQQGIGEVALEGYRKVLRGPHLDMEGAIPQQGFVVGKGYEEPFQLGKEDLAWWRNALRNRYWKS